MTTRTDRLANALGAMGCSHPRSHAVLMLEVWDEIREDEEVEAAQNVVGIGARLAEERGARYGHPRENFARIGTIWGAILGRSVTAEEVGLCLIGLKLARLVETPDDPDSLVDVSGYIATLQMLAGAEVTV